MLEQSLILATEIGDQRTVAIASWQYSFVCEAQGQLARAVQLVEVLLTWERSIDADTTETETRLTALRAQLS